MKTQVMGILNVTPDSFYDGGRYFDLSLALERAQQMIADGVDLIDLGAESSRPGAAPVSLEEELKRICPVVEGIRKVTDKPLSIDTYKPEVAEACLNLGANIINDITGLRDPRMIEVIAKHQAEVVIMHMQGDPENMQDKPQYDSLVDEVLAYLLAKAEEAERAGVKKENIILDPGIGFGKTLLDNYLLINKTNVFKEAGYPVLIGLSRKSLIGQLNQADEDRLPATIALNSIAVNNGADIIRVHDVKEHVLAMRAIDYLKEAQI